MKDNLPTISGTEIRKNLVTGAVAGAMLGVTFGFALKSIPIGLIAGILVGLAFGYRMDRMPMKMRYSMSITRRVLLTAALFMLTCFGFTLLADRNLNQTQLILAALLPIAAWAVFIITLGTAIAGLDELQRRVQTEAIAIGFAGTVIVCGGYGLLGLAGLFPALNWGLVILVMVFMWFIGKMWTLWRYR